MQEVVGPVQRAIVAPHLWAILAWPLVAIAILALVWCWRVSSVGAGARRPGPARVQAWLERWTMPAGLFASLCATVGHIVPLMRELPRERYLIVHLWRFFRIGDAEANADLAFDPLAACACCVVAIVSLGALVARRRGGASLAGDSRIGLLAVAAMTVALAENAVVVAIGLGLLASLSVERFVGSAPSVRTWSRATAVVSFLLGASVLSWALGGAWYDGRYVANDQARFASAIAEKRADKADSSSRTDRPFNPSDYTGYGLLNVLTYPNSLVFLDESRQPVEREDRSILRAPFARLRVPTGYHVVRVHPGGALDDSVVRPVFVSRDQETSIIPIGSSLSFREIRDELTTAPSSSDAQSVRSALLSCRLFKCGPISISALACVAFLWAISIALLIWQVPISMREVTALGFDRAVSRGLVAIVGVSLFFRLFPLFSLWWRS